jgi:hypothetical protein
MLGKSICGTPVQSHHTCGSRRPRGLRVSAIAAPVRTEKSPLVTTRSEQARATPLPALQSQEETPELPLIPLLPVTALGRCTDHHGSSRDPCIHCHADWQAVRFMHHVGVYVDM